MATTELNVFIERKGKREREEKITNICTIGVCGRGGVLIRQSERGKCERASEPFVNIMMICMWRALYCVRVCACLTVGPHIWLSDLGLSISIWPRTVRASVLLF